MEETGWHYLLMGNIQLTSFKLEFVSSAYGVAEEMFFGWQLLIIYI